MEKTLFAGLTVLEPDESINTDNGAYIGRDRRTIDRALELGAKTHRHTGLPGLSNPLQELAATIVPSAGAIDASRTFSIAYTVEDSEGGETLLSPPVVVSTPAPFDPPFVAPTAEIDYSAGSLLTDTYYYAMSYVDGAGGETPIGPSVAVEREPGYPNARVVFTGLDDGLAAASATGWRLYRAVGGGDYHLLAEGTTDGYTDSGADTVNCDIEPLADDVNTTNGTSSLILHLPSADQYVTPADAVNIYISEDGNFVGDVLENTYPVASAGTPRSSTGTGSGPSRTMRRSRHPPISATYGSRSTMGASGR
jgi:hypothetical protein